MLHGNEISCDENTYALLMRWNAIGEHDNREYVYLRLPCKSPEDTFLKRIPALLKDEKGQVLEDTAANIIFFLKNGGTVGMNVLQKQGKSVGETLLERGHYCQSHNIPSALILWTQRFHPRDKKEPSTVVVEVCKISFACWSAGDA